MRYNFDHVVSRQGTDSVKLEVLPAGAPEDVLPLWVADMDFPCAEPIIEAMHKRVDRKIFGYTLYDNERLKEAVFSWFRRRFDWEIEKSSMFFSPGVVPAFSFLINALSEEGDGIIIQQPVYYPFMERIRANKRVVVNNALLRQGHTYVMDYEDLERKFADPKNKGMILCSPHNPVGRVWTEEELRRLVDIARRYDKWIVADEIHCDLTRIGVRHAPLLKVAPDYGDRIIACTAPSKTFNLAGMQFSNIIIPNPAYQKAWLSLVEDRFALAGCNPFGLEAIIAAYNDGEDWLEQVREYIDANIRYIGEFIGAQLPEAELIDCQGTYLVWIDVRKYCRDPKRLENAMLHDARVALDEGYIFGEEGIGFERINVATPRVNIIECMERMKKALLNLKQ